MNDHELTHLASRVVNDRGITPRLRSTEIERRGAQRRRRRNGFLSVAGLLTVVAIGALALGSLAPGTESQLETLQGPTTLGSVSTPATSGDDQGEVLPQLITYVSDGIGPDGILTGTLVVDGPCVYLQHDDGSKYTLLFPAPSSIDQPGVPGEFMIHMPNGTSVGPLGAEVTLGGGYVPREVIADLETSGPVLACDRYERVGFVSP